RRSAVTPSSALPHVTSADRSRAARARNGPAPRSRRASQPHRRTPPGEGAAARQPETSPPTSRRALAVGETRRSTLARVVLRDPAMAAGAVLGLARFDQERPCDLLNLPGGRRLVEEQEPSSSLSSQ